MGVSYALEYVCDVFCEPCDCFKILLAEKAHLKGSAHWKDITSTYLSDQNKLLKYVHYIS